MVSGIFKVTRGTAALETALFVQTELRTAARFQAFVYIIASPIVDEPVSCVTITPEADRQIDANLRTSTVVLGTLVHATKFFVLVLPTDTITVFVAHAGKRDTRALATFELRRRITNGGFARAIFLVAAIYAFRFTVAIQVA